MKSEKFALGIRNAVRVCMNTQKEDRVFIICDQQNRLIGEALTKESELTGAETKLILLEDYGTRPMNEAPDKLIQDLIEFKPTVTYYTAKSQPGEISMRLDFGKKTLQSYQEFNLAVPRHGHMIGISPQLIEEGMTADYHEINRITYQIFDLVKEAHTITVTSSKGTNITASFNPAYKWIPCHGLYHTPGDRGNLPEGEVYTCPDMVNGIVVADVLGDYFSPKYGVLKHPITIEIKDSMVENVSCQNISLAEEFKKYLDSSPNGRRVGEFAIGTNTSITKLSGNLLQDEKIPGIHIAFGNPYPDRTGADWTSGVHVDVVPTNCTITVDDELLMKDGVFTL